MPQEQRQLSSTTHQLAAAKVPMLYSAASTKQQQGMVTVHSRLCKAQQPVVGIQPVGQTLLHEVQAAACLTQTTPMSAEVRVCLKCLCVPARWKQLRADRHQTL